MGWQLQVADCGAAIGRITRPSGRNVIHLAFRKPVRFRLCFMILLGIIVFIHDFLFIEVWKGDRDFP